MLLPFEETRSLHVFVHLYQEILEDYTILLLLGFAHANPVWMNFSCFACRSLLPFAFPIWLSPNRPAFIINILTFSHLCPPAPFTQQGLCDRSIQLYTLGQVLETLSWT